MEKYQVLAAIRETGVVAVIRGESGADAVRKIEACVEGGITAIELTFTVPFAHRILEQLAARFAGQTVLLGAGTVLDPETARIAILSGAEFVVSPAFNPETVRLCNRYRKPVMPGIMTVNEAIAAMEAGADIIKLFPGELFGPAFIKAIKGPLPYAQIMPTGGVDENNVADWIQAGAVAIGAGSLLTKGDIAANARRFLEKVREARGAVS